MMSMKKMTQTILKSAQKAKLHLKEKSEEKMAVCFILI
jgi:hypothetical protein